MAISEQLLYRNVQRFRGGLVFKAHRLLYHLTLGLRVIKKKANIISVEVSDSGFSATKITKRHSMDYEGFGTPNFGGTVTEFTPCKALKLIVWRQVDFW